MNALVLLPICQSALVDTGGPPPYRVVHFYFPSSGIIIALAVNSATDPNTNDDLQATAIAVHQTLVKTGAAHSS